MDYDLLTDAAARLADGFRGEALRWEGSPFEWITKLPSRTKGAIGEKLVEEWLRGRGFQIARSPSSHADRLVEGRPMEIKFSTQWAAGGYTFQQIRDQDYEILLLLGIAPHSAHCWVLAKSDCSALRAVGALTPQHTGRGGQETEWATINLAQPATCWSDFGGPLDKAIDRLRSLTR